MPTNYRCKYWPWAGLEFGQIEVRPRKAWPKPVGEPEWLCWPLGLDWPVTVNSLLEKAQQQDWEALEARLSPEQLARV